MARVSMLEGYDDLGALCNESVIVLDRIKVALEMAERLGVDMDDPRVQAAQTFWDLEDGFTTGSPVMLPWVCTRVTNEGTVLLTALNKLVAAKGGTTVDAPEQGDLISYGKTILTIVAVGFGIVYLGPPLLAMFSNRRPRIALKEGRTRQRRRRR